MKQNVLTEEQHKVLGELEKVFKKAKELNIGFVYDASDESLTAYNSENISLGGVGDDDSKGIDWDSCSIIENADIDWCDTNYGSFYVEFNEIN